MTDGQMMAQKPLAPKAPGAIMWLAYIAWQLLAHLLLPVFLLVIFLRGRREPLYRKYLSERFGRIKAPQGAVLIYASSLGETRAASPVIRLLLARGDHILLTHSSPAGRLEGQRLFGAEISAGRITQTWMPVDLFWATGRMLNHCKPALGLVVETELWPALMICAFRRNLPMMQINGNYTERSLQLDFRARRLWRGQFWQLYTLILTKSEERADRYCRAGVAPDRVLNVGELKFDLPVDAQLRAAGEEMRDHIAKPNHRRVLTIASSVEAEEEILAKVLSTLKTQTSPMPLVVWVPRSPQRFAPVNEAMKAAGWRVQNRSEVFNPALSNRPDLSKCDILIGDSLGEMDFYYGISNITFVGATLAAHGGHNIIEPLAMQRPVLTGPSIYGILYPALEAIETGALMSEPNGPALATRLTELFSSEDARAEFTARTKGFNAAHKGAAKRTFAALLPFLPGAKP